MEHLQSEEPFSSDPYFSRFSKFQSCFETPKFNNYPPLLLRPIQCENCKATFKTESALGLHLCYDQYIPKKKYGEPYKCEKCNKNYQNRKTFRYHLQSAHTAEKKYKCDKCGFSTKTSSALSSHVHRVHTKVELVKK